MNNVGQHGDVDLEEAGERVVKVGDDVAEQTDGEDGHDAHDELEAVRLTLHEQDAEERKEAETLEERPPEGKVEQLMRFFFQYVIVKQICYMPTHGGFGEIIYNCLRIYVCVLS